MNNSTPFIKITDLSLVTSLAAYARSEQFRGRSLLETMRKLMKFWLSFCLKLTPKGDRAKVERYLMQPDWTAEIPAESHLSTRAGPLTKRAHTRAARVDRFRGTLVAHIIRKYDIYGSRLIRNPERFYQMCARYLSRRKNSVNVHRASLIEPLKKFKGSAPNGNSRLKHSKHSITEQSTTNFARLAVDAWGSARITPQNRQPKGMQGVAGRVFFKTMSMVEKIAVKWLLERVRDGAQRAGFQARIVA